MKRLILITPLILLCAAWGASKIRWHDHEGNAWLYHFNVHDGKYGKNASVIEFGLRDDGVVVWREIKHATNSPAENELYEFDTRHWGTNYTNLYYNFNPIP